MKDIDIQLAQAINLHGKFSKDWWKNSAYYGGPLPVRRRVFVEWQTGDDKDPVGRMGYTTAIDAYQELERGIGGAITVLRSALCRVADTEKNIIQPTAHIGIDIIPDEDEVALLPLVFAGVKMCVDRWPKRYSSRSLMRDYGFIHGALFGDMGGGFRYICGSDAYDMSALGCSGYTATIMIAMQELMMNVPCQVDRRGIKVVNDYQFAHTRLAAYG